MSFRPGLCSVTFRSLAPAEVVAAAAAAGLAAIEWGGDVHVPVGNGQAARNAAALTRDAGLEVSSYGTYVVAPETPLDVAVRALETALELGTTHARVWAGTRDRPSASYCPEARRAVTDWLARLAGLAADLRMTLGLEWHPGSLTDSLASGRTLLAEIGADNVWLYWQPAPGLPRADCLAELAAVGANVCHLHVFAWDACRRRYPLSEQEETWTAILAAARATRWRGPRYAMLEFVEGDSPHRLATDAAVLRRMLEDSGRPMVPRGNT